MNTASPIPTRFGSKTLRLLRISRLLLRHYWALCAFRKLTDAQQQRRLALPQRFAQTLLGLGPLFVKLGQILSTRPDLLPPAYIAALAPLQDQVPPFPIAQVHQLLQEQFGTESATLFRSFDEQPVAAASLAQVHLAVLHDGTPVAVKLQRPLARERITADLELLATLLAVGRRLFPARTRRLNLVAGFTEFRRYTMQELDFVREAHTLERFQHNFAAWPDILIPQVYWEFVTPKVLTMARVTGLHLAEIVPTLSLPERQRLSHRLLEMEMKMFIADGFFHADLHPGNIRFTATGQIILLDFGMYGELSEAHRDHFILYWYAGLQHQTRRAFTHLIRQTTPLKGADEAAYYRAFKDLADRFYGATIAQRSLTQTYLAIILSGAQFGFVFPSDLLLQAKALTTAEALAFALTPDLRFETAMRPIIAAEFTRRATDGARLKGLAARVLPELLLFGELPPPSLDEPTAASFAIGLNWGEMLSSVRDQVQAVVPNVASLRGLLDPKARTALQSQYRADEVEAILADTWARYAALAPAVPTPPTVGARFMVQLAALTLAMYRALGAAGQSDVAATTLVYDMGWLVYTKMGEVPWALAGALSQDDAAKLRFATNAFRTFPFDAPSYQFQDVAAPAGTVAFDCHQCPVADYFRAQNAADLCVNTWCKLDYPLARQWGATLQRSGTIASGAGVCDFRWQVGTTLAEPPASAPDA